MNEWQYGKPPTGRRWATSGLVPTQWMTARLALLFSSTLHYKNFLALRDTDIPIVANEITTVKAYIRGEFS